MKSKTKSLHRQFEPITPSPKQYEDMIADREETIATLIHALHMKPYPMVVELTKLLERAVSEKNQLDYQLQVKSIQYEKLLEYARIPKKTRAELRL